MDVQTIDLRDYQPGHPLHQLKRFHSRIEQLKADIRLGIVELDEPQAEALLETSAEVLGGLNTAIEDYVEADESAWRGDFEAS